jgi:hypothetical protein
MTDDGLRTLVHDAAPTPDEPPACEVLWLEGRRRRRRNMIVGTAAIVLGTVVVAAAAVGLVVRLEHEGPASTVGLSTAGSVGTGEPAPSSQNGDVEAPPGFPVSMVVRVVSDDVPGRIEVMLPPTGGADAPVTMAIPLTLQRWDDTTAAWTTEADLYDQSRGAPSVAEPHDTGPAWYEWTAGEARGLPLQLPAERSADRLRICARIWPSTSDGAGLAPPASGDTVPLARRPGDPRSFARSTDASNVDALAVPQDAVTLCRPVEPSRGPGPSTD